MKYTPRLKEKYQVEIVNNLKGNYRSVMQVPKLLKICLNQGLGSALSDKKQIESAHQEMTMIAGQKAMLTKSTKDISNFKLRKGMPVGVMVTLRGNKMYEFLDRLITSTMPRIRDFNGISEKGFDGRGNYTLGIKEQIAFPEISIDKISKITGMDITFVTNTDSDKDALLLLRELGMPFKVHDDAEKRREEKIMKQKLEREKEEKSNSKDENEMNLESDENVLENEPKNKSKELDVVDNNQDLSEDSDKSQS